MQIGLEKKKNINVAKTTKMEPNADFKDKEQPQKDAKWLKLNTKVWR